MKKNPVVHFEMPAKDKKRVAAFYSTVFGWDMQQMGAEYGGYLMAMTTDSDQNGPLKPGAINGGFFDWKDDELNRAPHLVISVDNIDERMNAVTDAGGQVVGDKMEIPNVGTYVSVRDTEGIIIGMLQPPAPAK